MRNERLILLNTAVLGAGEVAGQLANFILVVSFARAFGSGVLGYYSISMAVGAVAALFVGMGTHAYLVREISRDPSAAPGLLGTLFPVQAALAVLAWLAASGMSLLLIGDLRAADVVMATCAYQVLLCLGALFLTPFQATERMTVSVTATAGHRVLMMALGLGAIWLGAGAGTVTLAPVASGLVYLVYAWARGNRSFGRFDLRFAPGEALKLFRIASPFFGLVALTVLYSRGSMIILSALATPYAVGLYAVADRFMVAGGLVSNMFNMAVYPALSRVAHTSLEEARLLAVRCLRLMLVATIPIATVISIFSFDIVLMVFGPKFRDSSPVLLVLAWTLPLRGSQWLFGSQLLALNRQASQARARFVGLGAFLAVTPPMILGMGYLGAAIAMVLCDALQLGLYWRLLKKAGSAPSCTATLLAPAAASAVTLMAGLALSGQALPLRLPGVGLVLAGGLWAFGAVRLHDLEFLRALVAGRHQ